MDIKETCLYCEHLGFGVMHCEPTVACGEGWQKAVYGLGGIEDYPDTWASLMAFLRHGSECPYAKRRE